MAQRAGRLAAGWRAAADVGGTFTDIVLIDAAGTTRRTKVLSTPPDFEQGVVEGLARLVDGDRPSPQPTATHLRGEPSRGWFPAAFQGEGDRAALRELVHASTVATNAILERSGPRTGLITTDGFRDILEIGRLRYPRLYDLAWRKPEPLAPRDLRLGVPERIDAEGRVVRRLDRCAAVRAARALRAAGAETVAVCTINSYANPSHERAIGAILAEELPGVPVSLSADVLPLIREYDRTSTTVINAYLQPVVGGYLARLARALRAHGWQAPLLILQSAGGVLPASDAARLPAYGVESGPSAGVIAAAAVARELGLARALSLDMGGTTAKAAVLLDGRPGLADEFEIGATVSAGTRLSRGGGYLLRTPSIDLAEVGTGGGSIAAVDAAGGLAVGPRSSGARPGPACYGRGGTAPTLTDANVVLGYFNPEAMLGGALRVDRTAAVRALAAHIAAPLQMDVERAAYAVRQVAVATMARALRAVSSERGLDPRDFALIAFGGSGPGHAAALAEHLGLARVVVPPAPGVFSAAGLLQTDLRWTASRSPLIRFEAAGTRAAASALARAFDAVTNRALAMAQAAGYARALLEQERTVELRYRGQSFEIAVPAPERPVTPDALRALRARFEAAHEATYGHREPDSPVQAVTVRVDVIRRVATRPAYTPSPRSARPPARPAWFDGQCVATPVLARSDLAAPIRGPAIVEEYDATTVIPPGWHARLDADQNIRMERTQ